MKSFAHSREWLTLYNYEKGFTGYKSHATESAFFFSQTGKTDPLSELKKALLAFQSSHKTYGHTQLRAVCAFPARYQRVQNRWPHIFPKNLSCPSFEEWRDELETESISLMYVGPYPNNPASMFGHSLIRLKREKGHWPLDYTLAFLANVNPNDGPFRYTMKGILGGYTGFYNIDPYYINAAQYNNAEGRDIWEYDLNLSEKELDFFIKHLWEVSLNTGFPYYFLDENCAYYLLTLLQAVDKRFLISKEPWLLHPIESLKMLPVEDNVQSWHPSIKKHLTQKLEMMDDSQFEEYQNIKEDPYKKDPKDPLVLDALIDHIKYINYAKKLKLSPREKKLYDLVHEKRSQIADISDYPKPKNDKNPLLIHSPSRLSVSQNFGDKKSTALEFMWGHHGINDSEQGTTRWSFIDYFGAELEYTESQKIRIQEISFVSIYALNPYKTILPDTSWRLEVNLERDCPKCQDSQMLNANAGYGFSQHFDHVVLWEFLNYEQMVDFDHQYGLLNFEFGAKLAWSRFVMSFKTQAYYLKEGLKLKAQTQANFYFSKNFSTYLKYEYNEPLSDQQNTALGLSLNF